MISDTGINAVIEDGSWFIFYAVHTPAGFRCHLEITVEPHITVVLDWAKFKRLGRNGTDCRKQRNGDWTCRLTPYFYLSISADQAEEFFAAHTKIREIRNVRN